MAGYIYNPPKVISSFVDLLEVQTTIPLDFSDFDDSGYGTGWDYKASGSFTSGSRIYEVTLTAGNAYDFFGHGYFDPQLNIFDGDGNWYGFASNAGSIGFVALNDYIPSITQTYYVQISETANYYEYASLNIYEDVSVSNSPTSSDDLVNGTSSAETINALAGDDKVYGGWGADTVYGGSGNDTIYGGVSILDPDDTQDYLFGGAGSDEMYGNGGNDIIYGGDQDGNIGDTGDTIYAGYGTDFVFGGAGNDSLYGGGAVVDPNDLGDLVAGEEGNDYILSNGGDDTINGGTGNDTMHGGIDDDTYVFNYGDGIDSVLFFQGAGQAGGDVLQFAQGNGINSANDLLSKMTFSEADRTVTFTFDADNMIIITDITSALTSGDIIVI